MGKYVVLEIKIDEIFKQFESIDHEKSVPKTTSLAAITAVIRLGIESCTDSMACRLTMLMHLQQDATIYRQ